MCLEVLRCRFWERPPCLPFPSAWRVTFDGVTLPNGATITVVLVTFTDVSGNIVTHLVGNLGSGPRSDGVSVAEGVAKLLGAVLDVSRPIEVPQTSQGFQMLQFILCLLVRLSR